MLENRFGGIDMDMSSEQVKMTKADSKSKMISITKIVLIE